MATKPFRGKFHIEQYKNTTSEVFTDGDMVTILPSAAGVGLVTSATSSSPVVIGVIQESIAATDDKYTTSGFVPVLVGDADAEWLFNASSGGAQTEVGQFVDLASDLLVDLGTAYTYGVVQVTGFLSTTQVIGKIVKKSGPAAATA